mmetsp:Transcript_10260/g.26028  ORF Transcript_10260/g.26028 Transcript_10260/m.26028 type:complete len:220 (+) Transcript_10260:533-1192(+)
MASDDKRSRFVHGLHLVSDDHTGIDLSLTSTLSSPDERRHQTKLHLCVCVCVCVWHALALQANLRANNLHCTDALSKVEASERFEVKQLYAKQLYAKQLHAKHLEAEQLESQASEAKQFGSQASEAKQRLTTFLEFAVGNAATAIVFSAHLNNHSANYLPIKHGAERIANPLSCELEPVRNMRGYPAPLCERHEAGTPWSNDTAPSIWVPRGKLSRAAT